MLTMRKLADYVVGRGKHGNRFGRPPVQCASHNELQDITTAFESALKDLGLNCKDPVTLMVAKLHVRHREKRLL